MDLNRYTVLREYNHCMNHVALVFDNNIGVKRIIKYCEKNDEQFEARRYALLREAEVLKLALCKSMPCLIEVIEQEERFGIVMEYFEGISLEEWLDHYGTPGKELIYKWAGEIASFLKNMHTAVPQMVYGDLKPDNLIVMPDESLRMLDFGTSAIGCVQNDPFCFGTFGYAPKEQLVGKKPEMTMDIYAFGAILLRIITGKKPEQPPYGFDEFRTGRDYDRKIMHLIARCMSDNPEKRYQNGSELCVALKKKRNIVAKSIFPTMMKCIMWTIMLMAVSLGVLGLLLCKNVSYILFIVIAALVTLLYLGIIVKSDTACHQTVIKYECNVVLTEKKRIGLWIIIFGWILMNGCADQQDNLLPVTIIREDGRSLLIKKDTIYETDESLLFMFPETVYGVTVTMDHKTVPLTGNCFWYSSEGKNKNDGICRLTFAGYQNGELSEGSRQFTIQYGK